MYFQHFVVHHRMQSGHSNYQLPASSLKSRTAPSTGAGSHHWAWIHSDNGPVMNQAAPQEAWKEEMSSHLGFSCSLHLHILPELHLLSDQWRRQTFYRSTNLLELESSWKPSWTQFMENCLARNCSWYQRLIVLGRSTASHRIQERVAAWTWNWALPYFHQLDEPYL